MGIKVVLNERHTISVIRLPVILRQHKVDGRLGTVAGHCVRPPEKRTNALANGVIASAHVEFSAQFPRLFRES